MTDRTERILEGLNAAQHKAVTTEGGALLVLAGAGSGKTRVITNRIAYLIEQGVAPWKILAVTFTNKAAAEMKERVYRLVGDEARSIWVRTFHSSCARILRQSAERVGLTAEFSIYDGDDQKRLMKQVFNDLRLKGGAATPSSAIHLIGLMKGRNEGPDDLDTTSPLEDEVKRAWKVYQERLLRANAVDFSDLLGLALKVITEDQTAGEGWAKRWTHLLVDEFQDTNRVQYLLAARLAEHTGNLCVVGDDDQSIYSWRGADISNIVDFEDDHPGATVVKLEQNYRSTGTILKAASALISNNRQRTEKTMWTAAGDGDDIDYFVAADERMEAEYVARIAQHLKQQGRASNLAVFYRIHAQSRVLEEALRSKQIPYRIVGGIRFYDRAEIKDLVAYLRLLNNPASDMDLHRIINQPKRGIGATTVKRIFDLADQKNTAALDVCRSAASPSAGLLGTGARKKVASFVALMDGLAELAKDLGPADLAEAVLARTGYTQQLAAQGTEEARSRVENLAEMVGSIRSYEEDAENQSQEPTLVGFLEQVALTSDVDQTDALGEGVTLMTVHAAKGLEFEEVVVCGLEEGLLPHFRSVIEDDVEEERRLAYVAFTRAKQKLHLTRANERTLMGQTRYNEPARFLEEIPAEILTRSGRSGRGRIPLDDRSQGQSRGWGQNRPWQAERRRRPPKDAIPDAPPRAATRGSARSGKKAKGRWVAGMEVSHPKFGVGTVTAWTGTPPDEKVAVFFPRYGLKTIVARFLQPL
ncbi:MAG: UvrD-helicase domain-containing protein [Deltaproteobacteria bacterium]|nr:UvrD-helicase domain-containing protein [Deltaproteobacteria bacterium]